LSWGGSHLGYFIKDHIRNIPTMLDFKWFNGSREEQFVDIFLIEFYAKYDLKL